MRLLELNKVDQETKISVLKELGYDSDGEFVLTEAGEKVVDKYINESVRIDNMIILPGSTIILDNNPLSIASYLEEFGDDLLE